MDELRQPVSPLLEFDDRRVAFIELRDVRSPMDVPSACVLTRFHDGVDRLLERLGGQQVVVNRWEDRPHPPYEVNVEGRRVGLVPMPVTGPASGSLVEEMIAFGCRSFVASGGSRQPFVEGRTWTTDAFFRETAAKIAARRSEDCITVDMGAASIAAVARFRGVPLVQLLYAGDDLSGEAWDNRSWQSQHEVRDNILDLAMTAALRIDQPALFSKGAATTPDTRPYRWLDVVWGRG